MCVAAGHKQNNMRPQMRRMSGVRGNRTAASDLTASGFVRGGPAQRGQSSQRRKISYALYFSPVNSDLVSFFLSPPSHFVASSVYVSFQARFIHYAVLSRRSLAERQKR